MTEERSNNYRHVLPLQIRFNDVDKFGHVNNTVYFQFYDTAKTDYIATVCKGVDLERQQTIPLPDEWRKAISNYEGLE